jgi:hypothetical protein
MDSKYLERRTKSGTSDRERERERERDYWPEGLFTFALGSCSLQVRVCSSDLHSRVVRLKPQLN